MRFSSFRALLAGAALLGSGALAAADFAGGGGAIPDNNAAGLDIPVSVSGLQHPVKTVRVSITLTHSFVGDLRVTLTSPNGGARLVLFSRAGLKRLGNAGASNNLSGTYVFDDAAPGDFWQAVAAGDPVAPGSYRTSTGGMSGISDHGGCATYLGKAFTGLSGVGANGTWTINVADLLGTDTGSVASVLLSVDGETVVFSGGFEEGGEPSGVAPGSRACSRSFNDMTGSGLASYMVVRNTGGGPNGDITWFVRENTGSGAGAATSFVHGIATDFFLEGDFDGDGIGDATVWRASTGRFLVRRSSQPSPILEIPLGVSGDDPAQLGDYDGDGITDASVYRAGASAGLPSFTMIRFSSTGELRTYQTGENGAFPGSGSDLDGDGKADIMIQNNGGGGTGRFRLYGGLDGVQFDDFNFGTPTDIFITGSHTGSPVGDVTVLRGVAGDIVWTSRDGETGIGQPSVTFGKSATDFPLSGDYDGDGIDDYGTWRPNADPAMTKFFIRRSTNPGVPLEVVHGQNGDYPPANSRRH